MAKVKTFKTIFPAVSVPLNDDYHQRAGVPRLSALDQELLRQGNRRSGLQRPHW